LDPYRGAAHAVVEACRNLACVGALPVGSTDCLNFGDPTRPEIMWEFVQAIEGMAEACREMEAPIVSGNVSLYNQTGDTAIKPTPSIAVVGTVADVRKTARAVFGQPGLEVALLGRLEATEGASLAGSIRVAMHDGLCKGRPAAVDYPRERAVQGACRALIAAGLVQVAHDTSEGGLAVALAEMCLGGVGWNRVGVHVEVQPAARVDQLLFGEDGGRIIVAYAPEDAAQIASIAAQHECPITLLGATGGDHMTMRTPSDAPLIDVAIEALHERWSTGFESAISS
jgi:phosphoribosylformylglycinamidine synthase